MREAILLLLALGLLAVGGNCAAQTVIHQCTAADGTPVFTDRTCASVGAIPAARAAHPLATRQARAPRHCPLDPQALRKRVVDAFHVGDANALAGLMLWRDYSANEASLIVRHLAKLVHTPFLGIVNTTRPDHVAPPSSAWLPPLLPPTNTPGTSAQDDDALTVKLGSQATPEVKFDVVQRDGCVWLELPVTGAGDMP